MFFTRILRRGTTTYFVASRSKIGLNFMTTSPFRYKRIVVIGTTGAGKSTLARSISARLDMPYIELDALYWKPNWTPAVDFRTQVEAAADSPAWVADGNYRIARDILWSRADALIWLDYGFWLSLGRLLRRTWRRIFTGEELWNGNRESVWNQLRLWSKDSLINWFFKTYWRRKREIPVLISLKEYRHLKLFHIKSPREADDLFESIRPSTIV